MIQDFKFNTSYGLQIGIKDVANEIVSFMEQKKNSVYKIIVGSDSEIYEDKYAEFVTAIVVHRVGNGGRFFWRKEKLGKYYNLHDRIIEEVLLSINVANAFLSLFKNLLSQEGKDFKWSFEVHSDVGENGPTKTLIQEVVGMVKAHNFEIKTKPDSYAASKVADIYT
jgi:hypothetical protein